MSETIDEWKGKEFNLNALELEHVRARAARSRDMLERANELAQTAQEEQRSGTRFALENAFERLGVPHDRAVEWKVRNGELAGFVVLGAGECPKPQTGTFPRARVAAAAPPAKEDPNAHEGPCGVACCHQTPEK